MTRKLTAQRFAEVIRPTPESLTPTDLSLRFISGTRIVVESAMPKWPNVIQLTLGHISFRSELKLAMRLGSPWGASPAITFSETSGWRLDSSLESLLGPWLIVLSPKYPVRRESR